MNGQRKSLERSHSLDEPQMTSCGKLLHMTGGRSESTIEINLSGCHGLYEICPPPFVVVMEISVFKLESSHREYSLYKGKSGCLKFCSDYSN